MTDYFFSAPSLRQLSTTKVVPYTPSTAFAALSDLSSYERATSLIYRSSVTTKDSNGLPKTAKLNVGYPALSLNEEWPCQVKCDRSKRTIEIIPAASEFQSSVVESYLMKWSISPVANDKGQAEIMLNLEVKFKGPVVDSMFAVLPDVVGRIMYRFSALVEAQDKKEREGAKKKPMPAKKTASSPAPKVPAAKTVPVAKPPAVKASPEVATIPVKRVPKKLEARGQASGGKQAS
ncbi:hypothetical protein M409DRAFT_25576 [Zasmidium cellare ATCC 36951]|uniref:Coenzyme Q-binding protein COQ10 START domain-containing protein n=1 Tax=Zasmidium cellare ATCC 36951 TaxID=1080233 RepID=A0A6A6CAP2_ZASCE|nr:uncharacterized protein M409DRAFT_25576 [Zasmidium cellare ATCC 36951]KAF2164234.1 hypothetical protein M409DRAFT_25576 [Zasmidium cellare ATCC 36951]